MKLSNLKIGYRLGSGFGLLILVFAVSSFIAVSKTKYMEELNEKLCTHPFAVSDAVKNIRADITAMHCSMKVVALAREPGEIGEAKKMIASYERDALKNFNLVLDRYLDDKNEVELVRKTFIDWRYIRNEVIGLMEKGKYRDAAIITKEKSARHVARLNKKINDLDNFAAAKSMEFHSLTHKEVEQTVRLEIILFGLSIILALVVSFLLTRSIINPLKKTLGMTGSIQKGDLSQRLKADSRDEIGQLADALDAMTDSLEKNRADLEQARNGLEIRVKKRTAELLEANVSLKKEIDERKRVEEILKESEKKYRTLFEDSKDVIFFSTPEGKVLDVNPAGIELFGYSSKKEFLNIDFVKELYFNPRDREHFKTKIEEQGFLKDFEVKMKKKNGTQIATLFTASIERDKNGDITTYRGIIRDITKRVQDEQLLKKMNAELRETNKKINNVQASLYRQGKLASIGQLAAGVAHEINNPLGFVSSNFSTLEKYFKSVENYLQLIEDLILKIPGGPEPAAQEASKKMKEHKEKIGVDFILDDAPDIFSESHDGFDRIKNIVENLRSFSRVDYENKIEKYDINQAIENTLAVARNEIKYAANVETEFSKVSLIECRGDEINQVLLNIIVNAAQAIKSQNREGMGKIKIKTFQEKKYVYCEISDNGPGMPGNIIDKIFDPFFTTKEVGKGTGLGLNICHDIVINKHDGDLTVKSETGKGSTFFIKLPTGSAFKARESRE